jgi:hypothetical protein
MQKKAMMGSYYNIQIHVTKKTNESSKHLLRRLPGNAIVLEGNNTPSHVLPTCRINRNVLPGSEGVGGEGKGRRGGSGQGGEMAQTMYAHMN